MEQLGEDFMDFSCIKFFLKSILVLSFNLIYLFIGIYALLGSSAFLSGVSRLTVALVVIMIEITGDLSVKLYFYVQFMNRHCFH